GLAAEALLADLAVGHHAPGSGQDRHPHAAQDGWDLVLAHVDAPARLRDPDEPGDDALVARPVLEIHAQSAGLLLLHEPEVLDESLALQDLGDADLELGRRDVHLL